MWGLTISVQFVFIFTRITLFSVTIAETNASSSGAATTNGMYDSLSSSQSNLVNPEVDAGVMEGEADDTIELTGLDDSPQIVRKLGIIDSSGNPTMEEAKRIMDMFSKYNMSFSAVSLKDYSPDDAYSFKKVVAVLRNLNPNAVIGTYHWPYAVATEHLRIPYFVTSQMPLDQKVSPFLIQLFPDPYVFAKAAEDMLKYYKFQRVVVFHDSLAGEIILERLCQQPTMEVTGFYVSKQTVGNIREQLKIVRSKFYTTFIGALSASNIASLLEQALSLSMFSQPYKWLLINMHLHEYSLGDYVDSQANITVLRLMVDPSSNSCAVGSEFINLRRAVFHDAVRLHAHISQTDVIQLNNHTKVSMKRIIHALEIDGCTGHLKFSRNATRTESFLQLLTLEGYRTGSYSYVKEDSQSVRFIYGWKEELITSASKAPMSSGTWRSLPDNLRRRVQPSKSFSSVIQTSENVFGDRPLRITIKVETPFVQKRVDKGFDNDHPLEYEGFLIDILLEMVKLLDFTFNIAPVPDGKFGSLKEEGWTGMIRQLVDKKADIALAPFQMTTDRAEVVDFTKPFMTKGTTVVVRRPEPKIWMFQFLSPFSNTVWCAIFVAFVSASLMLFAVSRVNSDRKARYTHNLRESFWYIWGTLLRGSLCGSPHAISSRIISSAWWFFCLILSSVYTANLAAFLTITISDVNINTAQDLALQDHFDYGTVDGSQTATFFNHTRMTYYSKMWVYMSVLSPSSMCKDTEVGLERVKKGRYAFIWDSPLIRHKISNDCDLMEIGSPFDLKGYGFAHQKDALYGDKLSWALLKLQDDGVLYKLERKWWPPQFCPSPSAKTESLDLETVAGMYVVILSGAILSSLVCLLQYCYGQLRRKRKARASKHKQTPAPQIQVQNIGDEFKQQQYWEKTMEPDENCGVNVNEITYAYHSPLHFRAGEDST